MRIAKADLVPTEANLREAYGSFGDLEATCADFCAEVNARPRRVTRRPPAEMLEEERPHLHRVPGAPHIVAFGQTRRVGQDGTISFGGVPYSVPNQWVDSTVWCRVHREELIVVALGRTGPQEIARWLLSTRGRPQIDPSHYPPRPEGLPVRTPKAQSPEEGAFLALGEGAREWLVSAAALGTGRMRHKMDEAVALAKLHGAEAVRAALLAAARSSWSSGRHSCSLGW